MPSESSQALGIPSYWLRAVLALALVSPGLSAADAGGPQIPLTCHWSEWADVSGTQTCHWRNRTIAFIQQDREVSRSVTFCAKLTHTRRRRCEPEGAAGSLGEEQHRFLEPRAFKPSGDNENEDPVAEREGSDSCSDGKCGALHGQWCYWIVYGGCEFQCRHAAKNETEVFIQKQRLCNCPKPRNSGHQCQGPSSQRERCECVSLAASFSSFLRTTEGILVAVGVAAVVLIIIGCCVSRVCCDADDGTDDFKISELPQGRQQQQAAETAPGTQLLLLSLEDPDVINVGNSRTGNSCGDQMCSATDSTAASSDETGSLVIRLPDCLQRHPMVQPPPLPPKRYKQQQHLRKQLSMEGEPQFQLMYTPPFPDEV